LAASVLLAWAELASDIITAPVPTASPVVNLPIILLKRIEPEFSPV
jgi:hypothetical protein